jgi:hypothetical protein
MQVGRYMILPGVVHRLAMKTPNPHPDGFAIVYWYQESYLLFIVRIESEICHRYCIYIVTVVASLLGVTADFAILTIDEFAFITHILRSAVCSRICSAYATLLFTR